MAAQSVFPWHGFHLEWIQRVIDHPEREVVQADGRIRRWAAVPEAEGKYCE